MNLTRNLTKFYEKGMKIITHIEYENKKILTETDVDFLEFEPSNKILRKNTRFKKNEIFEKILRDLQINLRNPGTGSRR